MRETAWRTDEPCPVCADRAGPGRHRRAGAAGRMPPVRLRRAVRHRRHRLGRCLVTAGRTTRAERMAMPLARARGQGPGRRARRLPAAGAAAPDRDRHRPRRAGPRSRAGTPWPRCARPAPSGPGSCGPRNAAKAGTSTTNPSSTRTRRPRTSGRWSPTGPRRKPTGTVLASEGLDTGDLDERIGELDEQITDAGLRGNVLPGPAAPPPLHPAPPGRRSAAPPHGQPPDGRQDLHRAGRQDLPAVAVRHADLPVATAGSARTEHPPTRTPTTTPRAARDALHFAALFDRFIQNLRRFVGYDLQYFAAIEPQRRLAPHVHLAIRGTISRAELREVIAATYHQVWWPSPQTSSTTAATCRSGTSTPAPTSTRTPARSCRPGTRPSTPSATRTSRGTWPGSAPGSTPRACSPDPGTPAGASATSPST